MNKREQKNLTIEINFKVSYRLYHSTYENHDDIENTSHYDDKVENVPNIAKVVLKNV